MGSTGTRTNGDVHLVPIPAGDTHGDGGISLQTMGGVNQRCASVGAEWMSNAYPDVSLPLRSQRRQACAALLATWRCGEAVNVRDAGRGARSEEDEFDGVVDVGLERSGPRDSDGAHGDGVEEEAAVEVEERP